MSWCGGGEISPTPGVEWRSARDQRVDLVAGQLAALAGLGALRDLDLQLIGVTEVLRGHAEAARCDLLDGRATQVAVRVGRRSRRILAALAGVRPAAEPVHRDRRASRAPRARSSRGTSRRWRTASRSRPTTRPPRAGSARPPARSRAGRAASAAGVERVERLGVLAERGVRVVAHGALQLHDRVGVPGVVLAAPALLVLAAGVELARRRAAGRPGTPRAWRSAISSCEVGQLEAADPRDGAGEVPVDDAAGRARSASKICAPR